MADKKQSYDKSDVELFRLIVAAFIGIVALGTIFFHFVEKWDYLDSFYFVIVTMSTVGYGNYAPVTDTGKVGNIVLIVVGIGIFGVFINQLTKRRALKRAQRLENKIIKTHKIK